MSPRPRLPASTARWVDVVVLAVGLALTAGLAGIASSLLHRQERRAFEDEARDHSLRLSLALSSSERLQLSFVALFGASDRVSEAEFLRFAAVASSPDRLAVQLLLRVPAADRTAFEAALLKAHPTAGPIWEAGPDGLRHPAGARSVYYPVRFAAPLQTQEGLLGFDVASEPVRRAALEKAIRSREQVLSEPFRLVEAPDRWAFIRYAALPAAGSGATEPGGVVAAVYRFADILDVVVSDPIRDKARVLLYAGAGEDSLPVAAHGAPVAGEPAGSMLELAQARRIPGAVAERVRAADRTLSLVLLPVRPVPWWHAALQVGAIVGLGLGLTGAVLLDRRHAREALATVERSEAAAALLLAANPLPVLVVDRLTLRLLQVNAAAASFYGRSREELLAGTAEAILAEGEGPGLRSWLTSLSPQSETLRSRHERAGGRTVHVDLVARPLPFEGHDAAKVVVFDVTERIETEAELRRSRAELEKAQRIARMGTWKADLEAGTVDVSVEAAGFLSWVPGRHPMDAVWGAVHPDDAPGQRAAWAAFLAGGPFELEHRMLRTGGAVRWLHVRAEAERDEAGRAVRATGIVQDVTESKETEERVRTAETRYQELLEGSSELVHVVDPASGRFLLMNAAERRLLGYREDEVPALTLWQVVAPEWADEARRRFARLFAGERLEGLEVAFLARDGRRLSLEGSVTPQVVGGRMVALLGIFRDVTERRRLERLRQVQLEATRLVSEAATLDEAVPGVLRLLAEAFSWDYGELWLLGAVGEPPRFAHAWHDGSPGLAALEQQSRLAGAADGSPILEAIRSTREPVWVEDVSASGARRAKEAAAAGITTASAAPLVVEGRVVGVLMLGAKRGRPREDDLLALLQDVAARVGQLLGRVTALADLETERNSLARKVEERTAALTRANAELARAGRMKDEFLATMSHELRTPLNAILGLSETLLEQVFGPLNEKQAGSLRTIAESGQHLLALINDILDLSKIEAGRLPLDVQEVPVEGVASSSLRFVEEAALKKSLVLTREVPEDAGYVLADPRRLRQVLVNLLSNAVKFTTAGGTIGLVVEGDAREVRFVVHDTGIGIDPEGAARLFEPFVQLDGGLAREHGGTGLGLALARRLTEMQGGTVALRSEPGVGTRVAVTLPRASAPGSLLAGGAPRAAEALPAPSVPRPAGSPLVLLAEDDEVSVRVIQGYLAAKRYRLVVATDGVQALEKAVAERPALILMDAQMPRLDGFDATRRLRAMPETASIPVVMVTALAMSGDRERCLAAGADAYVSKPVRLAELEATVSRLIAERGQRDAAAPDGRAR